jgi:hypothetical protein
MTRSSRDTNCLRRDSRPEYIELEKALAEWQLRYDRLVSYHKTLHTLYTLRQYEEEYKGSGGVFLRALWGFERDLPIRYHGSLEQVTLDEFWKK